MFRKTARHTVRANSRARAGKGLLVLVFGLTGVVVYWSGLKSAARSTPIRSFTSTAGIHQQPGLPAEDAADRPSTPILPGPEEAEQRIASAANVRRAVRQLGWTIEPRPNEDSEVTAKRAVAPVRQNLHVHAMGTSVPGELQISVAYTHRDAEYAARLVNVLAENYATDCRAEWTKRTRSAYEKAREASKLAQQEWREAKARLDELYEGRLERQEQAVGAARTTAEVAKEPTPERSSAPAPTMIDNPQWLELDQKLSELLRQQAELLADRTPAHPEVQEIRIRVSVLKGQLAATARRIPGKSSDLREAAAGEQVAPPAPTNVAAGQTAHPHAETVQEFRKLKEAVELAGQACEEAVRVEHRAWQRYQHPPQIEAQLAQAIEVPVPHGPGMGLVWMALAAAAAATAGLGMISTGAAMEPALATVAQVEDALPVPIVGTIPETGPASEASPARRRQPLTRLTMILAGLVLIAGCAAVLIRGLNG